MEIDRPVKDFITKEFMADKPDVVLDDSLPLIERGIVDSLGVFVLISFIEERFKIKVQPEDVVLENFGTVGAIRNLIQAKLEAGEGR